MKGNLLNVKFVMLTYFENKANLKKHAKSVHEAKKTFKCLVCVATLTQKGSLNIHIATVHDGKKQRSETVSKVSHNSFDDKVIQDLLTKQGDVPPEHPTVFFKMQTKNERFQ